MLPSPLKKFEVRSLRLLMFKTSLCTKKTNIFGNVSACPWAGEYSNWNRQRVRQKKSEMWSSLQSARQVSFIEPNPSNRRGTLPQYKLDFLFCTIKP
ncbi:hypothetical protein AVEN_195804-1 [Araneus ventricosus]|uniref:Uncharacterized protein n=1 Tax=Araneus ventricosus TaxID=182803 RepID=A0A4Y2GJ66_ARAVE|nr:hypothetical protein AVEN_195804-1 [Araneus ventricosus]